MEQTLEKRTSATTGVRPPIVVVVGHIDHGKTTLLDAIRKSRVAEGEAGGITQSIGAYQAEAGGRKITFIDTPGHEAFSAMRSRGARVADIAVLVVAADEGVKPQTEEAIRLIGEEDLPFMVAISKADKPEADPRRAKQELAERSVLVEGFGGTVPAVELSAKTGQGTDTLLETILLLAELEELTADPAKPGEGAVIESHLDPRRGPTATLLVADGSLRRGDFIVIGNQAVPVRILEDFRGNTIAEAGPADPVRIAGLPTAPALGERFRAFPDRGGAEAAAASAAAGQAAPLPPTEAAGAGAAPQAKHVVSIVLKAETLGAKEAIAATLAGIRSPELANRIVRSDIGDVTESDVKVAAATKNTFIVGFRVKVPPAIRELAARSGVTIVTAEVIYELVEAVRSVMLALAPTEIQRVALGRAKILATFREEKGRQIVGGRVEAGLIRRGARFEIMRNQVKIGGGRIVELQCERRPVEEAAEGQEFGIFAERDTPIAAGDILEIFTEEQVTPKL